MFRNYISNTPLKRHHAFIDICALVRCYIKIHLLPLVPHQKNILEKHPSGYIIETFHNLTSKVCCVVRKNGVALPHNVGADDEDSTTCKARARVGLRS